MLNAVLILMAAMMYVGESRKIDSIRTDKYELSYYNDGDDSVSFCEALVACSELGFGSRLVKVNEEDTQTQMNWMLEYWGYPRVWIGVTDIRVEGAWYWLDGTSLRYSYTNWGYNQPNSGQTNEQCGTSGRDEMDDTDGMWHDFSCDSKFGYICQRDISSTRSLSTDPVIQLFYSNNPTSFADAQKECESQGAKIVRGDQERYEKIRQILPKNNNTKVWIQDKSSDSGCAVMSYNRWQTHECNKGKFGYICETDEESVQE
ncbi:C-type mannose receptor 2-like [Styela clava]